VKTAEIFFRRFGLGLAVGCVLAKGLDVEGQQHRHRALADAGVALFGQAIEPRKGLRRRIGAAVGQGGRGGVPVNGHQLDGRAFHLAGDDRTADEQRKTQK